MSKNINLKIARARKDMTQKELAEQIGVFQTNHQCHRKGEYNPTIKLCLKICWALDCRLDDLFWEEKENEE